MTGHHTEATEFAPGYRITRDGRILASTNWRGYGVRELALAPDQDGYLYARITLNGRRQRAYPHRIVPVHFLPESQRKEWDDQVRHLNGEKTDNRAENLAWGSAQSNADDRGRHGRHPRGERNGFSKLTDDLVRSIRARVATGENYRAIAAELGFHSETIRFVVTRRTWKHV